MPKDLNVPSADVQCHALLANNRTLPRPIYNATCCRAGKADPCVLERQSRSPRDLPDLLFSQRSLPWPPQLQSDSSLPTLPAFTYHNLAVSSIWLGSFPDRRLHQPIRGGNWRSCRSLVGGRGRTASRAGLPHLASSVEPQLTRVNKDHVRQPVASIGSAGLGGGGVTTTQGFAVWHNYKNFVLVLAKFVILRNPSTASFRLYCCPLRARDVTG